MLNWSPSLLFSDAIATNVSYGILATMKSKPRNENTGEPKPKIAKDSNSDDDLSPPIVKITSTTTTTTQKPLKDPSQDLFKDTQSPQDLLDEATDFSLEDDTEMMNLGTAPKSPCSQHLPEPIRTPTPLCFQNNKMSYSNAVGTMHSTPGLTPNTRYKNNVNRTLTIWPRDNCTATQLIQHVSRSLDMDPADCLVGVERDTRVKTKNKFNLVLTSDQVYDAVKYHGIQINGTTYHPRAPRQRPPPRKRCFLPNFPVAASPELLMSAAKDVGVTPLEAIPRTAYASSVRIGGWILWVEPSSQEPELLPFDSEEFAIVWRERRPQPKTTSAEEQSRETDHNSETIRENENGNSVRWPTVATRIFKKGRVKLKRNPVYIEKIAPN